MVFKFNLGYTYFLKFYGMLGISRLLICKEKTVKPRVNYCFYLRFQHYRVFVADISYLSNKLYRNIHAYYCLCHISLSNLKDKLSVDFVIFNF